MNSIMITKELSDQFYALETSLFLKEYFPNLFHDNLKHALFRAAKI